MKKAFEFKPGFRISGVDAVFLLIASAGMMASWSAVPQLAFIIGYSTGHFFLFCNVFRISRVPELVWTFGFLLLAGLTMATGKPGWIWVVLLTLPLTLGIIVLEIKKPSYHGLFWRRLNPGLETWWRIHQQEL